MNEKRRSPRYPVERVTGKLHVLAEARILNMSLTGMAVETTSPMRIGRTYAVTLRHAEDATVRLSGTVVWCHLSGLRETTAGERVPVYHAGVEFGDTLTEKAEELVRFLERSAVVDVEKRISGRFTLDLNEPARLVAEVAFVVRTISAHGLLLETDSPFSLGAIVDMEIDLAGTVARTRGRVAFAREVAGAGGERISQLGVEFLELGQVDQARIESFIAGLLR
jgi:Tfp pilus assembly protein PilZ